MEIVEKINNRKEQINEESKALVVMLNERIKKRKVLMEELNKINNEIAQLSKSIDTANVLLKEFNELVE